MSNVEAIAENFLRLKEAALDILNKLPYALVIIDEAGTIQFVNERAEFLFECPRGGTDGLIGRNLEDTLVPVGKKESHSADRVTFNKNPAPRPMRGVEGRTITGKKLDIDVAINSVQTSSGKLSFALIKEKDAI